MFDVFSREIFFVNPSLVYRESFFLEKDFQVVRVVERFYGSVFSEQAGVSDYFFSV